MSESTVLIILISYFAALIALSFYTARNANNDSFFLANKSSKWYLVSFGMIGASISGVTFISVPGEVSTKSFAYLQLVFGYLAGYIVVAFVLMPIYYRLNVTSIYTYLLQRFGKISHKTGASIFMVARLLGSSARILLVAMVLQNFIFSHYNMRFEVSLLISIFMIWVCTYKGGMKTIVITDTFQTIFLVGAVILSVIAIIQQLPEGVAFNGLHNDKEYTKTFFFDNFYAPNHFVKMFLGGMFVTIGMTGLDQDLMQKNLTCKNIKEAQKNMITFSVVLVAINVLFLLLGAVLFTFAEYKGVKLPTNPETGAHIADQVYPTLAFGPYLTGAAALFFILGLTASSYASADSALTALTTSTCVDFININRFEEQKRERIRKMVHIIMAIAVYITVYILYLTSTTSAIYLVIKLAGYTYGPLIGLFMYGIFTKRKTNEILVPFICVFSATASYFLSYFASLNKEGYQFGFEIIVVNAFITFTLLYFTGKKSAVEVN
ncbi:MAG TPA: sodium:solute symporter [Flavobacteriales bacterium]|nr:sodium:solute symporter [Flavobacteriales bacterium]